MGMGALSPKCGNGREGTMSWGLEHEHGSVEMRVWDESVG